MKIQWKDYPLTVKLLGKLIMELRIAQQPLQEQRAPRPAGLDISLITTINTSKKQCITQKAQPNTEQQNR